ncbi:MAG: peptidylprolyl isomerase [Endozoicomonas sp. (ex Botrylloides leachii)]|nr:peptidylprolyl isomerase [Endozoicomonas sp. (ex Botrylloides leachii)]
MSQQPITQGSKVKLHFTLKLETGEVVDTTSKGSPALLSIGDGNFPAGFESILIGLSAGDEKKAVITPENAFGMPNPTNIQTMPRSAFQMDVDLVEGLVVSFSDASNTELPGIIRAINDRTVEVDFNHPLAGKRLEFSVQILDVA